VVVQIECRGSYEGRQAWCGVAAHRIIWGLGLQRVDLGEIAMFSRVETWFQRALTL
jgi:hypothetical protein